MDVPPISRGFSSRRREQGLADRIPPGQYVTTDFPVLSAGPTPQINLEEWTFALQLNGWVLGEWKWAEFQGLPQTTIKTDIHCVTKQNIEHVHGAPYHPQTQGKIERWHQTLKNRILLEHYYLPGDLERQVAAFVAHYNHARYHESLDNLTPADVYFGRAEAVLLHRERIKRQTIANRRLQHQLHAA